MVGASGSAVGTRCRSIDEGEVAVVTNSAAPGGSRSNRPRRFCIRASTTAATHARRKPINAGCSSKRTASAYHKQQTATTNVKRNSVSRLLAARSRNNTNAAKSASPAPTKTTNEPAIEPTTIVCAGPKRLNA